MQVHSPLAEDKLEAADEAVAGVIHSRFLTNRAQGEPFSCEANASAKSIDGVIN